MKTKTKKIAIISSVFAAVVCAVVVTCVVMFVPNGNTPDTNPKEIKTYIAKYIAGEGGKIVGESEQVVKEGYSAKRVYAQPDEHYEFKIWSDGHKEVGRVDSDLTEDFTVTAYFDYKDYTILYIADKGGHIDGSEKQYVRYGSYGDEVMAVAETGYYFVKWSDGLTARNRSDIASGYINVRAEFARCEYEVYYTAQEGGTITGESAQTVYYGESATTVKAEPNAGYEFVRWSDGNENPERTDSGITENRAVSAQFRCLFASGNGTSASPFVIETYEQFCNMRKYPDSYYELGCDMDLKGINHEPLFDEDNPFAGIFNGKKYTISNLTISGSHQYLSLFGYCGDNTLIGLFNVENAYVSAVAIGKEEMYIGTVAGVCKGAIRNVSVSARIVVASRASAVPIVGGLAGEIHRGALRCESDVDILINGRACVGGLIGQAYRSIVDCKSYGEINVCNSGEDKLNFPSSLGGLIGRLGDKNELRGFLMLCVSDVNILSEVDSMAGGLIGIAYNFLITSSHASGNVTASKGTVTGFICIMDGAFITKCYATGNVTGKYASGFIEDTNEGRISFCYSTGNVIADMEGSGFCNIILTDIDNCYSLSNVTAQDMAAGFGIWHYDTTVSKCYYSGNITSIKEKSSAVAFIWCAGIKISECFALGTVKAPYDVSGFVFIGGDEIINCYSMSNLEFTGASGEWHHASGISGGGAILKNCYYAGKISLGDAPIDSRIEALGVSALLATSCVENCHWLYYEDGVATDGCDEPTPNNVVNNVVRYEKAEDMYDLAEVLNAGGEEVWVNIENGFPQLKWHIN